MPASPRARSPRRAAQAARRDPGRGIRHRRPRLAAGPRWQAPPPPAAPQPFPGAPVEGHAVFATADRPRRTWIGALVVLLVLAIATGVVWWFAAGRPDSASADPNDLGVDRLPNPVSTPLSTVGEFTVVEGLEHKILQQHEASLLQQAGITEVSFRTAADGPLTYQLFLFETETQQGADRLKSGIADVGRKAGMADAGISGLPAGVTATKHTTADFVLVQAVYVTEGGAVRIFVIRQTDDEDDAGLAQALTRTVRAATAKLPVWTG
ncbi:hypothetical protein ACFQV2_39185 [Actinokineospora soli]|uniref:DUF1795 domain-containing protein n=1 Tax=Actinokineospora soli TaxID=1048753 RepID=A0ABW2TYC3_9PSEU